MKSPIIYIAIIAAFITQACSSPAPEKAENSTPTAQEELVTLTKLQFEQAGVSLGKIQQQNIRQQIKANGTLDVPPQNLISISAPYGGFLKSTSLLQGMHVHKGDIIATMEHPDYIQLQQDYLESKSQLVYLKSEYERQSTLDKEDINSKKTLQKSKADFDMMQARVAGLKAKLNLIHVDLSKLESGDIQRTIPLISPINGYVTQVHTNIGAFVSANTVLFEIVDTEHLHAEISVFEKDINAIQIGQKVTLTMANETKQRHASVYLIGREINNDRTVRVHCHLNEEDRNLLPGMYLTAFIDISDKPGNVLPNDAIVEYDGQAYVFVLTAKSDAAYTFKRVAVEKTGREGNLTAIESKESLTGKELATAAAYKLLAAMVNTPEEE